MELQGESGKLKFNGKGGKLFGILIVNILLTIVTLGIYYFWGKAKTLKYMYQETEFAGGRFAFHGKGSELFIGFLKFLVIFMIIYIPIIVSVVARSTTVMVIGLAVFYIGLLLIIPIAIQGRMHYRLSRTSWRGIHMGYRGKLKKLFGVYLKGLFFTIITLGIYFPWYAVNLRREIIGNVRLGNITFKYEAKGGKLFVIMLKGVFLSILTLGIYFFWYIKNVYNFYYSNIQAFQGDKPIQFKGTFTAGKVFKNLLVNGLITVFTLGIGIPWVIVRNTNFLLNNIELNGSFDPDKVEQTEADYKDATGEDMAGFLNIGDIGIL